MAALTGEQVAAVYQVLRDQALTRDEQEATRTSAAKHTNWRLVVGPEDTLVEANTKPVRETPEEAFADAVRLRAALLAAAGQPDYQGSIAADAVNGDRLAPAGWVGAVDLKFDMGES